MKFEPIDLTGREFWIEFIRKDQLKNEKKKKIEMGKKERKTIL